MAIKFAETVGFRVGDKVTLHKPKAPAEILAVTAIAGRYLSGRTAAAMKPWEAEGVSRRTWYRRKKEKREQAPTSE